MISKVLSMIFVAFRNSDEAQEAERDKDGGGEDKEDHGRIYGDCPHIYESINKRS